MYKEKKKNHYSSYCLSGSEFPTWSLYHVDLFTLDTPSFVRGLSNPHVGLRPLLEKLNLYANSILS